ncbi:MAG: glycosyltransferase family 4 protein [Bacteroidales bacterium]|nr:glycosyltransferase family 4 protein [Bacteroidales bacterium]MDY6406608.1 glycosyltransferase family 4 protein [Bacteroidales bacterium]
MRILYCIPHLYNSGGMERVLTQKVNWLAAHTEHELTIITTELTPKGLNECYFPLNKRVKVVAFDIDFNADYTKPLLSKYYAHLRRMSAYKRALTKYIRTHKIDLCISLGGKEIAFLRHLPCRTIAEMHFAMDQRKQLLMANHTGAFWSLLGAIRTRQLVRDVKPLERLVVLTEADKAAWEKAGCTNVTVIPNPCALNSRKSKVESRKTKTVLAVGRLHEQKGFDLLLRSWQPVEKHYPEWQLRIVGEGPKRAELETQIQAMGLLRVYLAGKEDKMAEEYAEASLFVLSSRYEGLPLALIEAMWCGTPCVSFDCPHGPAELLADGRGWLVPANDVEKLTQQIEYTLAHPDEASARAAKAQAFAQATYSEAAIIPQWEKVIDN